MARDTSPVRAERDIRRRVKNLNVDLAAMDVVHNIFRASTAMRNRYEQEILARHKLTFTGFTTLWVLWVWGSMEAYQLAEEVGISKSTLTGAVINLERLGFIERLTHTRDRRRVVIRATRRGKYLVRTLYPQVNTLERTITKDLSKDEKKGLAKGLRILLHTLENEV